MKTELKDDEILDESNVEVFAQKAVEAYFKKHMMVDAMLWREILRLLGKKYNIKWGV